MTTNYRLFGIERYEDVIRDCLVKHDLMKIEFDIKLLLTEAINNAFKHGNKGDEDKPIDISVVSDHGEEDYALHLIVQDSGCGFYYKPHEWVFGEHELLSENGRGLFLISQFSDKVEVENNSLHIYKRL